MEHHIVRLVGDRSQQRGFRRAWIGKHRQRLVRVDGEDHLVEALGRTPRRGDLDVVREALDPRDGGGQAQPIDASGRSGARRSAKSRR